MNSADRFDKIAGEVWESLLKIIPADLQAHFGKIHLLIEDDPSDEILAELEGTDLADYPEDLCGLYMGTPLTEESLLNPALMPGRIYLFRKALVEFSEYDGTRPSLFRLREEIAVTILHEIGHFFGLDEDDLERLGFD